MKPATLAIGIAICASPEVALAQRPEYARLHAGLPDVRIASSTGSARAFFADVNADGQVDMIYPHWSNLQLVLGHPEGLLSGDAVTIDKQNNGPRAVADMDGDGILDIVTMRELMIGVGNGSFLKRSLSLGATQANPTGLQVGDINGDGLPDVYRFPESPTSDGLHLNLGGGTFEDVTDLLPPGRSKFDVQFGDLDADGDLDLARLAVTDVVEVLTNDGTGVFSISSAIPATAFTVKQLRLADMDGDGDLDVVLGRDDLQVFLNDGAARFSAAGPPLGIIANDWALADVDGDGLQDFIAARNAVGKGAKTWTLYRANPGLSFTPDTTAVPVTASFKSPTFHDVDADGDLDMLAPGNTRAVFLMNDGTGNFVDVNDSPPSATGVTAPPKGLGPEGEAELVDLDGDGDLDTLTIQHPLFQLHLLENDGTGSFTPRSGPSPVVSELVPFDRDGDGDVDLLTFSLDLNSATSNASGLLFENDGSGDFTDVTAADLGISFLLRTANAADVDGDGDPDLVVSGVDAIGGAPFWQVLVNDGSGAFATSKPRLSLQEHPVDIELSDIDGDADEDVLVVMPFAAELFANDGQGNFSPRLGLPQSPPTHTYAQAEFLDLEGDGDLDVALSAERVLPLSYVGAGFLFENDGTGQFADVSLQWPHNADPDELVAGDFDGDGDPDLAAGGKLWTNDGNGTFKNALFSTRIPRTVLAPGDIDNDGDIDFWTTGMFVLSNLERQLAWRVVPRIGRPLTLDIHGDADAAWALYVSTASASIPTRFGLLQLFGPAAQRVGTGRLDANGRRSKTYQVPRIPPSLDSAFGGRRSWAIRCASRTSSELS